MGTMFSRIMYCEDCAKLHNPQHGQKFAVKGRSKSLALKIYQVSSPHKEGFTPHLVEIESTKGGIVKFTRFCGIHDCGILIREDGEAYKVSFKNGYTDHMPVKEWNAMVQFKGDTGYRLDD